jgi:hypothetical protein
LQRVRIGHGASVLDGRAVGRWYDPTALDRAPSLGEDGPLDPERTNADSARPAPEPPSGLFAQLSATREAAVRLVRSHVELAKAEAGEIAGEILRTLALGGVAAACLILVAFLLTIGLFLFFGEWLFGSLGWGVLMGTELLVGAAVFAVLAAVRASGLPLALAVALATGVIVTIVFGTNVLNTIYRDIASQFSTMADPGDISLAYGAVIGAVICGVGGLLLGAARGGTTGGAVGGLIGGVLVGLLIGLIGAGLVRLAINPDSRPMVVGILIWAVTGAIIGAIAGYQLGGGQAAVTGLGIGLVTGGLFGAFSAITFTRHVAVAIGISVFLGLAPAIAGALTAKRGIDIEALKRRYIPQTTIDTTKETLEWAKAQRPGARKS